MQAWIGEGSLNVLNAAVNSLGREVSCEKETTGDMGVESDSGRVIVILCFRRNSSASFAEVGATDVLIFGALFDGETVVSGEAEDGEAPAGSRSFLRLFFSFLELESASPPSASVSFRFRFLSFLESLSAVPESSARGEDSAGVVSQRRSG